MRTSVSLLCATLLLAAIISTVSGLPKICTPGEHKKQDCNTCTCNDIGSAWMCTLIGCISSEGAGTNFNRHIRDKPKSGDDKCDRLSSWKEGCNTCVCHKGGAELCTAKGCERSGPTTPQRLCQEEHDADRCFRCQCSRRGVLEYCTRKEGCEEESATAPLRETEIECEPNDEWEEDCNRCWCNEDGTREYCTANHCGMRSVIFDEEDYLVCKPNGRRKRACNYCRCNSNGTKEICTQFKCSNRPSKKYYSRSCQPFSRWKYECNTCWCSEDGTKAHCKNDVCEDEKKIQPVICQPQIRWKDSCNKCVCDAEGSQVYCTNKTCKVRKTTSGRKWRVCRPRARWVKNCNKCRCNKDGTKVKCVRFECLSDRTDSNIGQLEEEDEEFCEPHEMWSVNCNICMCNHDGTDAYCTRENCRRKESNMLQSGKRKLDKIKDKPWK